ncbi:MAG: urease accessory UreF family protein [Roseovarius sp.]|nr:urease accessory UreF family protein [Roseovarius sp.]
MGTTMTTEVLTLAQWLSPAYPVGAFAYSHGLEAAIGAGWVNDGAMLQIWLHDILTDGSGHNDCILLRAAHAGQRPLGEINATGLAFAASAERRREALLQGAAFAKTTAAIWTSDADELIYPVAVGTAAATLNIDPTLACAMYTQAMMSNLIAAAQRLMPLGQIQGQAILKDLTPTCQRIAEETAGTTLDDLHAITFMCDIASMQHETQSPRIFRT